jgi:DNA helicase-2/ATP-dependent DNA helicase PcrA
MNLEQLLNESQLAAVTYCDGPQLVIAGAGSGKTRVLTYKIAYLLEQGMQPWQILALTFTNKAAREMKSRIADVVGQERARYLEMGTFHSIFARILRSEAAAIGFRHDFTIYDQADQRSLVKAIVKEMELDDKKYKPADVAAHISSCKNRMISPAQYAATHSLTERDTQRQQPKFHIIYGKYNERLGQANAMDFDDLLTNTHRLFDEHEDIRRKYAERFRYVLVDEYQDTNAVQKAIVVMLARDHGRVCVVGDDAQSIYSFRGANVDNILDFSSDFQGTRTFKLEQNYRSTQNIVQAAGSLISHNKRQIPKNVFSQNDVGERLRLREAFSDKEEAAIVCRDIERLRRKEHGSYSDFAVLYRTNAQSRSFEEQMRKEGIPYRIYGGQSFYQRKEIKDMIAYFRLVVNPDDEEAFKRIVNYPARGIGDTTVGRIVAAATQAGQSLWQTAGEAQGLAAAGIAKATATKVLTFCNQVKAWASRAATEDAYTVGRDIINEAGIVKDLYADKTPESVARQENLEEFLTGMHDFVDGRREEGLGEHTLLADFLQEVALLTDLDSDDDSEAKVTLMTIHAAKGLVFPSVYIVGLEENIFPSPMSSDSVRALEEERRLLYVAITRAERHCMLTCAQNRFRYGRLEYDAPSRFISDIDPALIDRGDDSPATPRRQAADRGSRSRQWQQNAHPVATQFRADPKPRLVAPRKEEEPVNPFFGNYQPLRKGQADKSAPTRIDKPSAPTATTLGSTPTVRADSGDLREGSIIEHQRFGRGQVLRVEGYGQDRKATVEFKNIGTKQLLLKFAKYTIVTP